MVKLLYSLILLSSIVFSNHTYSKCGFATTRADCGRPATDTYYESQTGHFWIHYDNPDSDHAPPQSNSNSNNIPDFVEEVAIAAEKSPSAIGVVLMNHGLVTWGETAREAYDGHINLISKAERFIGMHHHRNRTVYGPIITQPIDNKRTRQGIAQQLAPTLRGLVSRYSSMLLRFDDSKEVLDFIGSKKAELLTGIGPATPDHTLHTKRLPLWVPIEDPHDVEGIKDALKPAVENHIKQYESWFANHQADGVGMLDPSPRIILVPGVGMWTIGKDMNANRIVNEIYKHTIGIVSDAEAVGEYKTLSAQDAYDAEYWPLELYKLTLAPPEKELARKVALITGAASGIGRAIARRFAEEGAHVVVTDQDRDGADDVATELVRAHGKDRAVAYRLDVTNEKEVKSVFGQVNLIYGGLDILISNAGIASPGLIAELSSEDWRHAFEVNATGHFLIAKEAVNVFRQQNTGGSIVFIGSKNVQAPGKEFGAYSASKAAEVQLARILALETSEYGVRVNIVSPDAIFRDSKLWSETVRKQRADTHGVGVDDLEDFYRNRNLLKVAIYAEDVAEAALFFSGGRALKTTGAILTVDGGVKEAFLR